MEQEVYLLFRCDDYRTPESMTLENLLTIVDESSIGLAVNLVQEILLERGMEVPSDIWPDLISNEIPNLCVATFLLNDTSNL